MEQNDQTIDLMEKGVLSSILADNEVLGIITEMLEVNDFHDPKHKTIYSKILEFYRNNRILDAISIIESIIDDGFASLNINAEYFVEMFEKTSFASNQDPVYYADRIKENSHRRKLNLIGREISQLSIPGSGMTSEEIVGKMQEYVREFTSITYGQDYVTLESISGGMLDDLQDRFTNGDATSHFIPTGFYDLDDRLGGGFAPGQMVIVAGRPGMGKTTVALDFLRNASLLAGKSVMFFSLEMDRKELTHKLWSAEAHVKHKKIRKAEGIEPGEWERIMSAKDKFDNANFSLYDDPNLDMLTLRAKCEKQKARPEGLDIVVVDYLQLMQTVKADNRQQEISNISREIKILAKELGVPILILSQLNRGNTNRPGNRPLVSDLRESGSLEQDADIVLLVHRPEEYDPNEKPGITELILGKVRAGNPGIVDTISLLEYSKFANSQGIFQASEKVEMPNFDDDESVDSTTEPTSELTSEPTDNSYQYSNDPSNSEYTQMQPESGSGMFPVTEPIGNNPDSEESAW